MPTILPRRGAWHRGKLRVMLSSGPVVVVDYDPEWVARFDAVARDLKRALGSTAIRVDHIGSTAVPGLAAKPVVDVQVSVRQVHPVDLYREAIEGLGYVHRPHPEVLDREFFRPPGARTVHLHIVGAGSRCERAHLLMRDFLRADDEVSARYVSLKRRLAEEFRDARQDYQDGKNEFVAALLLQAEEWAAATGWAP
jgi:GrpB-like predicted nucleotidyltransferase (UPF0157 family)